MNWFDAIIPNIKRRTKKTKSVPEGLWTQCRKCATPIYEAELIKSLGVCANCGHHHHLEPPARAQSIFDDNATGDEIGARIRTRDFLGFVDEVSYKDRLKKSGRGDTIREGLRVFAGRLDKRPLVIACFDWSFMGGSMGSVVGERFSRGVDHCCELGLPLVVFTASGGARMQEGLVSLMQMAKTTAAQAKLAEYGLPFISVLCNPTSGGVAASFAMTADVVIAEPDAMICFAGERVIQSTVREELPPGFQRSDFLLAHGGVDMVVDRRVLRATLARIIGIMMDSKARIETQ